MIDRALAQEAYAAGRRDADALLEERLETAERRVAELERRSKLSLGSLPCGGCGGPHRYDTSIPSVLWNRVIRAKGLSEYLCTSCIIREFVNASQSFTAELYGDGFHGARIEMLVNSQPANAAAEIQDENNALRWKLYEAEAARWQPIATAPKDGTDILAWAPVEHDVAFPGYTFVVSWDGCVDGWLIAENIYANELTHWMPLLAPPQATTEPSTGDVPRA